MSKHDHDEHDELPDEEALEAEIERDVEEVAERIQEDVERAMSGWGGDREARQAARDARREAHRIERDALREARRAARDAARELRREDRRVHRMKLLGGTLTVDSGGGGRAQTEEVERRFKVSGMPHLRVRNVSGRTSIKSGAAGEVHVHAVKRVHGWSEERAKRLLENVEIRMEQDGDEITVEPTLYQQERGWLDLFRGGRVTVDFDITVPREAQIEATTVSGELAVSGTRGPLEARSVSGEIEIQDVQGPMRLRSVSGEVRATGYAGHAEANSTSGEIRFERSRIKRPDIVSVSGEVRIDGALVLGPDGDGEGRIKTVSGDIDLLLADPSLELDFQSLSGDLEVDAFNAKVEKRGRREWHVGIGQGGPRIRVKTVSGDLAIRRSGSDRPAEAEASSEEPMPAGTPAPSAPKKDVLELLQAVARGELSVEAAASTLDERRR